MGKVLEEFHQIIKTQTGWTIKRYCLDNNPTITNNHIRQWAKTKRVHFKFIIPYLLNKDDIAKRDIRTNVEKLWSLKADCDLPKKLWPLDLSTTVYLKN